jgi:hypothetical protein
MDGSRFDHLARRWATRRTAIGGLIAALSGLTGLDAEAKKKRKRKRNEYRDEARKRQQHDDVLAEGKKKKKKKCKGGTVKCGKKLCVNASTDAQHCGGCGNRCGNGQACVGGACVSTGPVTCPAGQVRCGGGCVDLTSDEAHCGGCGQACQGDLTCLDGTCGCADASDTKCGNLCVDTQSDNGHCGQCGQACGTGKRCQGGQCETATCGQNELLCGGTCVPSIGAHPCCSQIDCGVPGSSNHIYCDVSQHQCRCNNSNYGICQRTDDGRGICRECCPGGIEDLNCLGDLGCYGHTSCSCPAGESQCPGGSNRCYQDPPNPDGTRDDPTMCFDGANCTDCTRGGTRPYVCCWGNSCVDTSGLGPNVGHSLGQMCGGCEKCPPNKACCNDGPGTPPKCKTPANGGFCPLAGVD